MKLEATPAVRIAITVLLVLLAVLVLRWLWIYYKVDPWTRDGRVRADVVQVTPDVSGLVTEVLVHDNQAVKAGEVLLRIDQPRYQLALDEARAAATRLHVQLDEAQREDRRDRALRTLVSEETREQSGSKLGELQAGIAQADAAVNLAQLNLDRTEVKASVDGTVTAFQLHPGDYAVAGHPLFAIIDLDSLYVVGYFEETKIARVHVGDRARVRLMGESRVVGGHVESIAGGIEDRDRSVSPELLASVTPTFNWVRLSQRIPVRIHIDQAPADLQLISGRTATVEVLPGTAPSAGSEAKQ
jgi:RND family efflux transporter MFP subunit